MRTMYVTPNRSRASPPESVLVYGRNPVATTTLVVGLALRRHRYFAWADCAVSATSTMEENRNLLDRGKSRNTGDGVDVRELSIPSLHQAAIERVLSPENRMDSLNLMSYLTLPRLLQELAAMSTSATGESSVVLTNIDALDSKLRSSVFGDPEMHRHIHQAIVSLLVTSKSPPTLGERSAFDRIYRIDVPPASLWVDGILACEKGAGDVGDSYSSRLREAWQRLGLDDTLLPPT